MDFINSRLKLTYELVGSINGDDFRLTALHNSAWPTDDANVLQFMKIDDCSVDAPSGTIMISQVTVDSNIPSLATTPLELL